MSDSLNHEAPKVFRVASWAMAVVGAFVFSSAVGLLAYSMVNNPISAQTEQVDTTEKCTDKETAILNNYPQNPQGGLTGGVDYGKLDNSSGAKWSCSAVCITGYDKSKSWSENESVVRSYLEKSKAGGKDITIYKTYDEFNATLQAGKLTQADMVNTVILSSLDIPAVKDENKGEGGKKARCEGVSQDYVLSQNDKIVSPVAQNNTYAEYQEAQKKQEEEAAASPQPAAREAAKNAPQVPVLSGGQKETGKADETAPTGGTRIAENNKLYNDKAAACMREAEAGISKISILSAVTDKITFYRKLKVISGYRKDRKKQYDECLNLLKAIKAKYPDATEATATSSLAGKTNSEWRLQALRECISILDKYVSEMNTDESLKYSKIKQMKITTETMMRNKFDMCLRLAKYTVHYKLSPQDRAKINEINTISERITASGGGGITGSGGSGGTTTEGRSLKERLKDAGNASSAGGIIGGVLFGPVGSVIGSIEWGLRSFFGW